MSTKRFNRKYNLRGTGYGNNAEYLDNANLTSTAKMLKENPKSAETGKLSSRILGGVETLRNRSDIERELLMKHEANNDKQHLIAEKGRILLNLFDDINMGSTTNHRCSLMYKRKTYESSIPLYNELIELSKNSRYLAGIEKSIESFLLNSRYRKFGMPYGYKDLLLRPNMQELYFFYARCIKSYFNSYMSTVESDLKTLNSDPRLSSSGLFFDYGLRNKMEDYERDNKAKVLKIVYEDIIEMADETIKEIEYVGYKITCPDPNPLDDIPRISAIRDKYFLLRYSSLLSD